MIISETDHPLYHLLKITLRHLTERVSITFLYAMWMTQTFTVEPALRYTGTVLTQPQAQVSSLLFSSVVKLILHWNHLLLIPSIHN